MLKFFLSILLIGSVGHSEVDNTQSVTGVIEFEESVHTGDVSLFVASQGGVFLPKDAKPDTNQKLEKNVKVNAPDLSSRWILIGRKSGKNLRFDINLKKGTYQLSCIVKKSKPDCDEVTLNREKVITRCFPGKEDSVCDQIQIEVQNRNIYDVTLRAGATEVEKP